MAAQPTTDDLSHFDGFIRQFISYDINKFVLPIDRTVFLSDDLDDFLQTAIKNEASDIFVKTGTPIWARIYGLAGADLTFTGRTALAPASVVALTATSQDPGLRTLPGGGVGPGLFWFATSSKN
mgnify:CR=1 FL=1